MYELRTPNKSTIKRNVDQFQNQHMLEDRAHSGLLVSVVKQTWNACARSFYEIHVCFSDMRGVLWTFCVRRLTASCEGYSNCGHIAVKCCRNLNQLIMVNALPSVAGFWILFETSSGSTKYSSHMRHDFICQCTLMLKIFVYVNLYMFRETSLHLWRSEFGAQFRGVVLSDRSFLRTP